MEDHEPAMATMGPDRRSRQRDEAEQANSLDEMARQFGGIALPGWWRIPQALLGIWTSPCHGPRWLWAARNLLNSYSVYRSWKAEQAEMLPEEQEPGPFDLWLEAEGFVSFSADTDVHNILQRWINKLPNQRRLRFPNDQPVAVVCTTPAGYEFLLVHRSGTVSKFRGSVYARKHEFHAAIRNLGDFVWSTWAGKGVADLHVVYGENARGEKGIRLEPMAEAGDYIDTVDEGEGKPYQQSVSALAERLTRFQACGFNRRILLCGPPGTGKTTLVRRLARKMNSGRVVQFSNRAVGRLNSVGIGELLKLLRPRVLLLDDVDRGNAGSSMLHMLDKIESTVIGTVNTVKGLDPALLRPGRFDEVLQVGFPGGETRRKIILHYAEKHELDLQPGDDSFTDMLAAKTEGFAPAEILELIRCLSAVGIQYMEAEVKRIKLQKGLYNQQQIDRVVAG